MKNYQLTIGWLYPELMSTYGDRGNILVLQKIAEDNGITVKIERINQTTSHHPLTTCDMLFMGGAQDLQQEIVNSDLLTKKGDTLIQLIENEIPGLYICGAYQFLGNYYKDAYGTEIKGLGVFDMFTEAPKDGERLIGNIVVSPTLPFTQNPKPFLVGFENHGGRTYLGGSMRPFASVVKGFGNNGEDQTEGINYKNSIGTYLHGPILPSNPELAVNLLELALKKKYEKDIKIKFEDELSKKAKMALLKRVI